MKKNNLYLLLKLLLLAVFAALLVPACKNPANVNSGKRPVTTVSIVGDAALGWENADGDPLPVFMTRTGNNIFEYEGTLTPGYLIFSCDANPKWSGRWFLPDEYDDVVLDDGLEKGMFYSTKGNGGEAGYKWIITKAAAYLITLNTANKTVQCVETGEAEPIGTDDAFNNMWLILCKEEAPLSSAMIQSGDTWTITETFNNNDYIKFYGEDEAPLVWGTQLVPDTSVKWFCPAVNGTWATGMVIFKYGRDNSFAWRIPGGGEFTITLNPKAGTITFEGGSGGIEPSSTVWLVYTKEAAKLGVFDAREMTGDAGVYTWEGALSGWYKFCSRDEAPASYSVGLWFGPNANNKAPEGVEEDAFMDSAYAWFIPRGHYTVTFSPTGETAAIVKTGDPTAADYDEMWVIGTTAFKYESDQWNAPKNTARKMTKVGDGTWTWTYNFGANDHFRIVCRNNGIIFHPHPGELTPSRGDVAMIAGTEYNMLTRDQFTAITMAVSADVVSWWFGEGTTAGIKTITVNPLTQKVKFASGGTPVDPGAGENIDGSGGEVAIEEIDTSTVSNILLYGGGCATGWSTSQSSPTAIKLYTQSANIYAWIGQLSNSAGGQIKFHNGTQDIGANAYTEIPGIGGTFPVAVGSGNVWHVNVSGVYVVRLDLNANQVSFIIQ